MSRPLAYKNTNLDAKPNPQEISASSDSWLRRIKQPAIGKTVSCMSSFCFRVDQNTRREGKEKTCPASIAVEREGKEWLDHHREGLRLSRQRLLPAD